MTRTSPWRWVGGSQADHVWALCIHVHSVYSMPGIGFVARGNWLGADLAAAAGHWAEAMEHFEAADKSLARGGNPWRCARLRLDWAEAHTTRGEPGDRQRAAELLRQAQEAFQDMGVPRYAAVAQERLRKLGAA